MLSTSRSGNVGPNQWASLAVFLMGVFLVALAGALFTGGGMDGWYQSLEKPAWNPAPAVFGQVWTTLYLFLAVAAWLIWRIRHRVSVATPMTLFLIQLGLNVLWSFIFFDLRLPGLAMVELFILWVLIFPTVFSFGSRVSFSGFLLLPYLLWVSYALTLNIAIWRLN